MLVQHYNIDKYGIISSAVDDVIVMRTTRALGTRDIINYAMKEAVITSINGTLLYIELSMILQLLFRKKCFNGNT